MFHGVLGNIYNIGTQDEYSVLEVTKCLIQLMCPHKKIEECVEYVKDRDFNDKRYFISFDKLTKLGWKQKTNFMTGLKKTIHYYKHLSK